MNSNRAPVLRSCAACVVDEVERAYRGRHGTAACDDASGLPRDLKAREDPAPRGRSSRPGAGAAGNGPPPLRAA